MSELLDGGIARQAHRRQFVIGPRPVDPSGDWLHVALSQTLVLSHCRRLSVLPVRDLDGAEWWLLGMPIQACRGRGTAAAEIAASRTSEVPELGRNWAGRWVLIGQGRLQLDASGLLGCYYTSTAGDAGNNGSVSSSAPWVSSSLPIIADVWDHAHQGAKLRHLVHGVGFDWEPPPVTGLSHVSKLLPSQTLCLTSGQTKERPSPFECHQRESYEQLLDEIADVLVTTLENVAATGKKLWLPLTSGNDSRLLLAAALAGGVPVATFTQRYASMPRADRELPPQLAELAGVSHQMVDPGEFSSMEAATFDRHTGGQCPALDREFFARGQWSWLDEDAIVLRGSAFELGRCAHWSKLKSATPSVESILRGFEAYNTSAYVKEGVARYVRWVEAHPDPAIDWRDRFYLENAVCGQTSCLEQALDLLEGTSFVAANSHRHFSLLLAIPQQVRARAEHCRDLIGRLAPELLQLPINPPSGRLERLRIQSRKYFDILRTDGVAATLRQGVRAINKRRGRRSR